EVVDFITKIDNKTYPLNKDTFKDSWRTIYGLHRYLDFSKIIEFFKAGLKPDKVLSEEDFKKFDLNEASQQQKETVRVSFAKMRRIEKKGLIVPSERFGKIVVDIGKKVGAGVDAAWAFGCQTYIIWSPESGSFFITSTERLDKEKIGQGGSVRGYMWIKARGEKEPLTIKLADILKALTDGRFEPTGELAEFIKKEEQISLGEKLLKEYKIENLGQLLGLEKLLNKENQIV
ncbi:hypothetical protein KKF25_02925, partial [Patescibacteria group bacterium]|nr:hypothetical protein [Patescibacteria group bacterium]